MLQHTQLIGNAHKAPFYVRPHGHFDTYSAGGTLPDETEEVEGLDKIYQSGGGYTGGYLSCGIANASAHGQQALIKSWNLDFINNRDGVNSSPYPLYHIWLTTGTVPSTEISNPTDNTKVIAYWNVANGYTAAFYVFGTAGSTLYSDNALGAYAYAGYAMRMQFDHGTDTIKMFGNTSGVFTSMTELGSYTFTSTDRSNMADEEAVFYIAMNTRGAPDGYRVIKWYETA